MPSLLDLFRDAATKKIAKAVIAAGYDEAHGIAEGVTFLDWCQDLAASGMKIDGKPFSLENRQALIPIYKLIPTTLEEAKGKTLVIQKATQLGLTVWEVLAMIYMAIKFGPVNIGFFLPDQSTAAFKSEHRFMRIVRSVPELLRRLVFRSADEKETRIGEGNILTRVMGESIFMFLWTTGKVTTESRPMDIVGLDEVQEMTLDQIDKVMARMGDSDIGFSLLLSTANMPDLDINYWYQLGNQLVWHTRCQACGELSDLSDPVGIFPAKSIKYERGEYYWACPACGAVIDDPQVGEYIPSESSAENLKRLHQMRGDLEEGDGEDRGESGESLRGEDAKIISCLLPRTISPKITPRKMYTGWARAKTGDQKKSYYNRVLARPYIDANQLPVTMAHCNECVAEGLRAGLQWKAGAVGTYMGIDQMGGFNAVMIKERMPDGRQAVIHVEAIFGEDPFSACDALMERYGVAMCVVEQLPNVNDARRFANRHKGRVFLAGYADLRDDQMTWGDQLTRSDRKTSEEDRSRYTVTLNQYKCMQTALYRIRDRYCLFPDPDALIQDVIDRGGVKRIPILRDWVFMHFTKTALVVDMKDDERKGRGKVAKIGIDPHYAFANMLCDVAWARNNGTSNFFIPEKAPVSQKNETLADIAAQLPGNIAGQMIEIDSGTPGTCGACSEFKDGRCLLRGFVVKKSDLACPVFEARR